MMQWPLTANGEITVSNAKSLQNLKLLNMKVNKLCSEYRFKKNQADILI